MGRGAKAIVAAASLLGPATAQAAHPLTGNTLQAQFTGTLQACERATGRCQSQSFPFDRYHIYFSSRGRVFAYTGAGKGVEYEANRLVRQSDGRRYGAFLSGDAVLFKIVSVEGNQMTITFRIKGSGCTISGSASSVLPQYTLALRIVPRSCRVVPGHVDP